MLSVRLSRNDCTNKVCMTTITFFIGSLNLQNTPIGYSKNCPICPTSEQRIAIFVENKLCTYLNLKLTYFKHIQP